MYTIGQVSEMFGLPISTLRYSDNEGLFPYMQRQSGIRQFGETEVEALRVIECLKASGLEIKDIKKFMEWCVEGPSTYKQRKELFETRKAAVEADMKQLQKTLDMLRFKCWYYDMAIRDGSEDRLNDMLPDDLPPDIKQMYDNAHS
ncbi:MAG: MerR family transcriptional regulator [Oscillospiraceae bacterium]|nr:MerR family transcriptional regulator [Oscillospiraceae bacterium]